MPSNHEKNSKIIYDIYITYKKIREVKRGEEYIYILLIKFLIDIIFYRVT